MPEIKVTLFPNRHFSHKFRVTLTIRHGRPVWSSWQPENHDVQVSLNQKPRKSEVGVITGWEVALLSCFGCGVKLPLALCWLSSRFCFHVAELSSLYMLNTHSFCPAFSLQLIKTLSWLWTNLLDSLGWSGLTPAPPAPTMKLLNHWWLHHYIGDDPHLWAARLKCCFCHSCGGSRVGLKG